MPRKRTKIRYCYEDHTSTVSDSEKTTYQLQFAPLIRIITEAEDDREVMATAKNYDREHGTDMLTEAIRLTTYCIACSKFDCDC